MEQEKIARVNNNVAVLLTTRLIEVWRNFIDEFHQSFDENQLDPVLSMLRELKSSSQNPTKKRRLEFMEQEESMDTENNYLPSLEKKVFSNHLLAKSIFKHLPKSDLLSCRLMNSYWNENATELLLKREFKIRFQRKINRFYLIGSNWKSLDMFTELLKRSRNFPCNKFVFYGGNLGNDDAQRFFSFYGSNIKYLKISFYVGQVYNKDMLNAEPGFSSYLTDSRVIGTILSHQLPNLEHLNLDLRFQGDYEWSGHTSLLFPPRKQVKLPKLKNFTYESSSTHDDDALVRQLLVAATNLVNFDKEDDSVDFDSLDNLTATGKVNCIGDLMFPVEAERLQKLEEMLKHEPKLTVLSLDRLTFIYKNPQLWKRISIILTNLLESSKQSLNDIHDFNALGFLRQLQLPILENMTALSFEQFLNDSSFNDEDVHDYSYSFLPRGASFSRNFPRLSSVEISCRRDISSEDAADWWLKYFPTDEIVPTVKDLFVGCSCPLFWVEKLSKMFPNLQELYMGSIKDFPNCSKIIWTSLRKLKSLDVTIDMSSPLNSYPALDSSFTGLSPEMCKTLETFSPSVLESVAENYMENEPSLLDLTDLQNLRIKLQFSTSLENYKYPKVLSPLTGICVFKPLASLREVNIKCLTWPFQNHNKTLTLRNLETLTPYKVKIETTD